jgi:hypothetical protein
MPFLERGQPWLGAARGVMLAPFDADLAGVLRRLIGAGARWARARLQTWWEVRERSTHW